MTLADLIKQPRFASPAHEAVLNVFATASYVAGEVSDTLAPFGVTQAQYNVLRILRGCHPGRYACSEIAERLLDRTPDVTRLLVRLESRGLLTRERAEHDRRVVEVTITEAGLDVLSQLDAPVDEAIRRVTSHLSDAELETLSGMLDALRTDQNQ